jgi:carboxypeptidase D
MSPVRFLSPSLLRKEDNQLTSTPEYRVDGTKIPDVDFDAGESYAGLMPVSAKVNETRQLYFWFWPSPNELAQDEILIWLNGGPGCSSLEGILQENGPFLWQYGTFKPVQNPWTWVNLTNMLWVSRIVLRDYEMARGIL